MKYILVGGKQIAKSYIMQFKKEHGISGIVRKKIPNKSGNGFNYYYSQKRKLTEQEIIEKARTTGKPVEEIRKYPYREFYIGKDLPDGMYQLNDLQKMIDNGEIAYEGKNIVFNKKETREKLIAIDPRFKDLDVFSSQKQVAFE